jgi:hypothetical protein
MQSERVVVFSATFNNVSVYRGVKSEWVHCSFTPTDEFFQLYHGEKVTFRLDDDDDVDVS